MSSIRARLHYKALTDLVELMAIFSIFAVGVDLYWSISDFFEQSFPHRLIPVLFGLSISFIGMGFAMIKYHLKLVSQFCVEMKLEKLSLKRGSK